MERTYKLNEIKEVANQFWENAGAATVFAFHGQMGAGKTTFIHAICEVKSVKDVISSPTFSIINEYLFSQGGIPRRIYHIDLYRLKDEEEARMAGVEDCLYSGELCLVEWPEKAPGIFPEGTRHVDLVAIGDETRKVLIRQN